MAPQSSPRRLINEPIGDRGQRGKQGRLAGIEAPVVLDHVDRVPGRLLDHLVDRVRSPRDAHLFFHQRPKRAPAAAVVGAQEGPAISDELPKPGFLACQPFFHARVAVGQALFSQGLAHLAETALDDVLLNGGSPDVVDGQNPPQHRSRADGDQEHVDASAESGGGIVGRGGHGFSASESSEAGAEEGSAASVRSAIE